MEKKIEAKSEAATGDTFVTVRLTGSTIRRDGRQREYVKALGLRKLGSQRTLKDSPAVRGLIRKAHHLIAIVD